jgi:hypothetical protein
MGILCPQVETCGYSKWAPLGPMRFFGLVFVGSIRRLADYSQFAFSRQFPARHFVLIGETCLHAKDMANFRNGRCKI